MICMNGKVITQLPQFSVPEVEVTMAAVELESIRRYRAAMNSRGVQAASQKPFPRVYADIEISRSPDSKQQRDAVRKMRNDINFQHDVVEEIEHAPALWVWDYLRRSGARGLFLPLSGGQDSTGVAAVVCSMANILMKEINNGNQQVLDELRRITQNPNFTPTKLQDIVGNLFVTCYMGNRNSKNRSKNRAFGVAEAIGSKHYEINIDQPFDGILDCIKQATDVAPRYEADGGCPEEDIALQNITNRSRMVVSYLLAQMLPWTKNEKGHLLVLGASNIGEGLRGYYTKYDTSSADINPIGGINRSDMNDFLRYFAYKMDMQIFQQVADDKPVSDMRPVGDAHKPVLDEELMGLSYKELDLFATLRKVDRMGPLTMYSYLLLHWAHEREMNPH